ncbi:MAG: rhodanese-like domain-containing protein [Ignavibacteriaceae bacterium]
MISRNLLTAIIFILSINACAQVDHSKSISNDEFREMLKNNPSSIILDVRTPEELTGPLGKIDNVINIPVQQLQQRINELEQYRDSEIIIICRTQNRSSAAVDILLRHGFKAKCVLGGMLEYSSKIKKSES